MSKELDALRTSVARLHDIVGPLDDAAITGSAYPSEWTVAQVMSHLGSGNVIFQRMLDDKLAGVETPADFNPGVWDGWNAKTPRAQVDDALAADAAFVARLETVSEDEQRGFSFAMGPATLDFDGFVGLRLNEHTFHTWDIEVALDPTATIPAPVTAVVIDNLGLIAQFTGKPNGDPTRITVRTTDPERDFVLELTADAATLESVTDESATPSLELPAEAFTRVVYGRLDPAHTPAFVGDAAVVDRLRATYPGP